jgi:hypothetical protein
MGRPVFLSQRRESRGIRAGGATAGSLSMSPLASKARLCGWLTEVPVARLSDQDFLTDRSRSSPQSLEHYGQHFELLGFGNAVAVGLIAPIN